MFRLICGVYFKTPCYFLNVLTEHGLNCFIKNTKISHVYEDKKFKNLKISNFYTFGQIYSMIFRQLIFVKAISLIGKIILF